MEENFVGGINAKVRESLSKFGKRTSATGSQISFTVQQGKKPNQNSSDYQSHHGAMKNNLKEAALRFSVYSRVGDEIVSSFPKVHIYS